MTANNDATKVKGKVKEKAGWLAGDREVEAKGKVEAEKGDEPTRTEHEEAKDEVRADHGDI
ncbi:MAG TPA: CsbD family protein [Acidimicrobiales bacterium]|nr:CsbD family protein [Acidimicrobiales bacterium]